MKNIKSIILLMLLSAGLFTTVDAQRRGNGGGERSNRQPSSFPQARTQSAPSRSFNNQVTSPRVERATVNNNAAARIQSRNNNIERSSSIAERNTTRVYSPSNSRVNAITNNAVTRPNREPVINNSNNVARINAERNRQVVTQRNTSNNRVLPNSSNNSEQRYDRNSGRNNNNNYRNNNYRNNNYAYNNNSYRNNRGFNYRNYSYNRNYYYRTGYSRRIYFMPAPRYRYRPYNSISIYFGNYPYYYSDGIFYDYYSGYYQPIFPPYGIHVATLPFGYSRIYVGINPYYYYNGIFYRNYEDNYEVVDAPMGAVVTSLPSGAKSVVINGEEFYELNGTYFKEDRNSRGSRIYVVVGKNGEINNTDVEGNNPDTNYEPQSLQLQNGDVVAELPEGSKVVTLNGEKLYVAPDDTYLKEEANGDSVQYRVVGK